MSEDTSNQLNEDSIWSPDIVQATLPFLSPEDIRNLSLTNKYFHKLLNYDTSDTLWHELFYKVYSTLNTNDEPFRSKSTVDFMTCAEEIITRNFPETTWQKRYEMRTKDTQLYTWGCLKHGRLGYNYSTNSNLNDEDVNNFGIRVKSGVNKPVAIPWFPSNEINTDDWSISQVSGGGFSFQILTKSGKIYSTGSTYTGGHKGPGPSDRDGDYNPFRLLIRELENSLPNIRIGGLAHINTTGTLNSRVMRHHGPTPVPQIMQTTLPTVSVEKPHRDIYSGFAEMERTSSQYIPGNDHIRRMFPRNVFDFYCSDPKKSGLDKEKIDSIKFTAISSGRSHFLALDQNNEVYSWDTADSDHGVLINFDGIDTKRKHPILKIGCGWDFSCVYIYGIGLAIWNQREALKQGQTQSDARYQLIPDTDAINGNEKVIDFACMQNNHVIYITNDGEKIWEYSQGIKNEISLPIKGKISKVSASFSSLVVFANSNCYTFKIDNGKIDTTSMISLELDDKNDCIISLASGDYHSVALTQSGSIYTWGVESQACGCLGLGGPSTIVEEEHLGTLESTNNIRVTKPTKIRLGDEYKCVAITAGGWQSAALILGTNDLL